MNLLTFVKDCTKSGFLERHKTICLRSGCDTIPLIFFSRLLKKIKTNIDFSLESLCLEQTDSASVMAKLSTSFLGNTSLYWLKRLSDTKPKKRKEILSFLKTYKGPNSVIFFVDGSTSCKPKDFHLMVDLPERVDQKVFMQLTELLTGTGEKKLPKESVAILFKRTKSIDLDSACLLTQYLELAGRKTQTFIDSWMDKIVAPEHSLLELSKHFFSRDSKPFFTLWKKMGQEYSPQFWISFWSEQVWRAYNFVEQSKKGQFLEAKRVSFRLPYIFTQRLWRQADLNELRSAHNFLYAVDCSLKNGGAPTFLELFYTSFFTRQF